MFATSGIKAQTITRLEIDTPKLSQGGTARLKIEFASEDTPWCGLAVDWGTGDKTQDIRVGEDGRAQSPIFLSRVYSSPGEFKVTVTGKYLMRGLRSAAECNVSAAPVALSVLNPDSERIAQAKAAEQTEKQRADLERRAAELALREAEIAKLQAALVSSQTGGGLTPVDAPKLDSAAERRRLEEEKRAQKVAAKEAKELERQRLAAERAEAIQEKRRKELAAIEAKEAEKRRIAEERERAKEAKRLEQEAEKERILKAQAEAQKKQMEIARAALQRPLLSPEDPRIHCQSAWGFEPKFSALSKKISLTGLTDVSFQMLADTSTAGKKEQEQIAELADKFKKCINDSNSFRKANYSKEMLEILESEDAKLHDLSLDLYNRKLTFGRYNQATQKIAKESLAKLDALTTRLNKARIQQEEAAKARAAALVDAEQRQERERQEAANQRHAAEMRKAELRQRWETRCQFDAKNAYERYVKSKEGDCNTNKNWIAALCVAGVISSARDYQRSAYESCMSGAP